MVVAQERVEVDRRGLPYPFYKPIEKFQPPRDSEEVGLQTKLHEENVD
jgi:hypothetical protein